MQLKIYILILQLQGHIPLVCRSQHIGVACFDICLHTPKKNNADIHTTKLKVKRCTDFEQNKRAKS